MSNPHKYDGTWTMEQHRDELIDRLGEALRLLNLEQSNHSREHQAHLGEIQRGNMLQRRLDAALGREKSLRELIALMDTTLIDQLTAENSRLNNEVENLKAWQSAAREQMEL